MMAISGIMLKQDFIGGLTQSKGLLGNGEVSQGDR